jgi:hypothetical protein
MNLIATYLALCLLSLIPIVILLVNAPMGWEDIEGFHNADNNTH